MTLISDESTIFGLTQSSGYTGLSSGSQGFQDFSTAFTGTSGYVQVINVVDYNTTSLTNSSFNQYFKMQGYNPLTRAYETWHCRGTPLLNGPSGHNLVNISIIATWLDR